MVFDRTGLAVRSAVAALTIFGAHAAVASDLPVDGAVAHWSLDAMHARRAGTQPLSTWPDAAENGADLTELGNGAGTTYRPGGPGGKPVASVGKLSAFGVESPLPLDDHTVFVVYRTAKPRRALFSSSTERGTGVLLDVTGAGAVLHDGTRAYPYTRGPATGDGFRVLTVARDRGRLRAWRDGRDVSSGANAERPIEVGVLFELQATAAVRVDGEGLELAELAIYDRFLGDADRAAVEAHLAEKFEIESVPEPGEPDPEKIRARLRATGAVDMNPSEPASIEWTDAVVMEPPLERDPDYRELVRCTTDDTLVRMELSVPMIGTAGADVRVLILVDGTDYLSAEGNSGPLVDGEETTVRVVATAILDAGSTLEIVTLGEGEPGPVAIGESGVEWVLEVR